jgi:hypothetical protein
MIRAHISWRCNADKKKEDLLNSDSSFLSFFPVKCTGMYGFLTMTCQNKWKSPAARYIIGTMAAWLYWHVNVSKKRMNHLGNRRASRIGAWPFTATGVVARAPEMSWSVSWRMSARCRRAVETTVSLYHIDGLPSAAQLFRLNSWIQMDAQRLGLYVPAHNSDWGTKRERERRAQHIATVFFSTRGDRRRPFGEVVRSGTRRWPSCDKVRRIESEKEHNSNTLLQQPALFQIWLEKERSESI